MPGVHTSRPHTSWRCWRGASGAAAAAGEVQAPAGEVQVRVGGEVQPSYQDTRAEAAVARASTTHNITVSGQISPPGSKSQLSTTQYASTAAAFGARGP